MMTQDKQPHAGLDQSTRNQHALECADEAIEALFTVYWADSFDYAPLRQQLAAAILMFTRRAVPLSEPCPHPELLEE